MLSASGRELSELGSVGGFGAETIAGGEDLAGGRGLHSSTFQLNLSHF